MHKKLLLIASLLLLSCISTKEDTLVKEKLSAEDQKKVDEYLAEIDIGRDMAGRLLTYYGTVADKKVTKYLNKVGSYVGSFSDTPERKYMFAILNNDSINAFACPGGYILVTLGLLKSVDSEAELAAVLGHEVAHVSKKHMFNTLKSMKDKDLDKAALQKIEAFKQLPAVKMRARPKPEKTKVGQIVAKYLSSSSGAGINILKAAKAGVNMILEKGIDHKLEFEADAEGVKYSTSAGYEPFAMVAFLKRANKSASDKVKRLQKTHPSFLDRIQNVQLALNKLNAKDIIGALGVKRFKRIQKRLK